MEHRSGRERTTPLPSSRRLFTPFAPLHSIIAFYISIQKLPGVYREVFFGGILDWGRCGVELNLGVAKGERIALYFMWKLFLRTSRTMVLQFCIFLWDLRPWSGFLIGIDWKFILKNIDSVDFKVVDNLSKNLAKLAFSKWRKFRFAYSLIRFNGNLILI